MAPNSLSPASLVIAYHSQYGAHKMTLPTKEWFPTSITGNLGSYTNWGGTPVDAEEMVNDFVDLIKVFCKTTTVFDAATVYTMATPTSPNIPQKSVPLAIVGTSVAGGTSQAQSSTFNCKTTANGDFKIVLLDQPFGAGGFVAVHPAGFGADVQALEFWLIGPNGAISGRDDAQVASIRKITYDLNDKLQKQYKMSA